MTRPYVDPRPIADRTLDEKERLLQRIVEFGFPGRAKGTLVVRRTRDRSNTVIAEVTGETDLRVRVSWTNLDLLPGERAAIKEALLWRYRCLSEQAEAEADPARAIELGALAQEAFGLLQQFADTGEAEE